MNREKPVVFPDHHRRLAIKGGGETIQPEEYTRNMGGSGGGWLIKGGKGGKK